jgi:uncharacterized lipoprotein YehR (DUF1307 family)
MKKITLLFAAILVISFASCKKDRICTCTYTNIDGTTEKEKTTYYKAKKKDVRKNCIGGQTEYTSSTGVVTIYGKSTCELN